MGKPRSAGDTHSDHRKLQILWCGSRSHHSHIMRRTSGRLHRLWRTGHSELCRMAARERPRPPLAACMEPLARQQQWSARQAHIAEPGARHLRTKRHRMRVGRKRRRPQDCPEENIHRRGTHGENHDLSFRIPVRPLRPGKLHRTQRLD